MIYDCTVFFFFDDSLIYAQHWHFEWRFGFIYLFMRVYDGSICIVFFVVFSAVLYIMKKCDI